MPQARGQYQVKADPPFVPGNEAAGEVSEIGERVSSLARGDKVIVLRRGGGYASESMAEEQLCVKVPRASADLVEAAALLVNYGTAHLALSRRAALQPRETVLVTAAAGPLPALALPLPQPQPSPSPSPSRQPQPQPQPQPER